MKLRVWGLASGIGATKDAAHGAFTWREYEKAEDIQNKDWLRIVNMELVKEN
jgi:hypothetical protein